MWGLEIPERTNITEKKILGWGKEANCPMTYSTMTMGLHNVVKSGARRVNRWISKIGLKVGHDDRSAAAMRHFHERGRCPVYKVSRDFSVSCV